MSLWEEIHICIQHLKIGYSDIMTMPTGERRFHLSLLIKKNVEQEEKKEKNSKKTGKGKRTSTISGDALKTQIKSGNVPLN